MLRLKPDIIRYATIGSVNFLVPRRCVKPIHVDAALASCIDYMYAKRTVTHTTGELYANHCSAGLSAHKETNIR